MLLPVNEIFETLQGEATLTGTPAIFIRLQGCAVGCPWCDTRHTWAIDHANEVPFAEVAAKIDPAPTFALVSARELALWVHGVFSSRHVVITGGEPCDHDLGGLVGELIGLGHSVQVETSGTAPIRVGPRAWVTLSPKIGMPGGKVVLAESVQRADEIKMPVGSPRDVAALLAFLEAHHHPRPQGGVWVQPLSRSPKATTLCIEAARCHGWRVSVQTHAFIGVR